MHKCHFISVSFFWFCPEPSQRSESHGLRKMKAAALVHVTLPMFLFLFHWSETPDFSEPKNRPLWTLTQRLTLTFLLSLYRLFSFRAVSLYCPFLRGRQSATSSFFQSCVPVWERKGEVREFVGFFYFYFFIALALIRKSHNQAFHKAGKLTSQPAAVLATDTYQEHLWKWPFMVSRRSCFTLWWVGRALFGRLRYLCYIKGFKVFHQRAACNLGLFLWAAFLSLTF